jgi:hypothetical protein
MPYTKNIVNGIDYNVSYSVPLYGSNVFPLIDEK